MTRKALVVALALALVPSPARAHTVGGDDGVEIELLLVGLGATFFAFALRRSQGAKPWAPWVALALGVAMMGASVAVPRLSSTGGQSFADISIVRPERGARVEAGRPVRVVVDVANAPVADSPEAQSGGHLHLFVDGRLEQMPYGTNMSVELAPGGHELTVEYVNFEHVSFDPRVEASVQVTAE
jgi:hypothetical protein